MKNFVLVLTVFFLTVAQVPAQFGLGKLKKALDTVTKLSDLDISEEDEIALGESISLKIRSIYGVEQDVDATRYVSLVGLVVADKSDRRDLPYRFIILDSDQINAFAAPGGFIHITRGALASMKDEAELAGVLGHEIGHVTEKHTINGIKKMRGIELAEGQTTLRGNAAVLDKVADQMTDAILAGFGRKEELESDEVGVEFAYDAGYDPNGLMRFLETLKKSNEREDSRSGLFASHPETDERIKKLEKQIRKDLSDERAVLADRYVSNIEYQPASGEIEELAVEGARGVAGGSQGKKEEKKKSRFSLSKLSDPLASGEKQERAEVTGSGAARGVGKEAKEESGPKNPNLVAVQITKDDLKKFKRDGNLS